MNFITEITLVLSWQ